MICPKCGYDDTKDSACKCLQTPKKIDWSKPVETLGGLPIKILSIEAPSSRFKETLCAIGCFPGDSYIYRWSLAEGLYEGLENITYYSKHLRNKPEIIKIPDMIVIEVKKEPEDSKYRYLCLDSRRIDEYKSSDIYKIVSIIPGHEVEVKKP